MKKALSILLILAAVFGFYGGAVTLSDVLDSKAYWEEEGRKSDENLDKLEDGVNQLEENADAYLDGKVAYADGIDQLQLVTTNIDKLMGAKGSLDKAANIVAENSGGKLTAANAKDIYNNVNELMNGYSKSKAVATVAGVAKQTAAKSFPEYASLISEQLVGDVYDGVKTQTKAGVKKSEAVNNVALSLAYQAGAVETAQEKVGTAYKTIGCILTAATYYKSDLTKDTAVMTAAKLIANLSGANVSDVMGIYNGVQQLVDNSYPQDKAIAYVAKQTVAKGISEQTGGQISSTNIAKAYDQIEATDPENREMLMQMMAIAMELDVNVVKNLYNTMVDQMPAAKEKVASAYTAVAGVLASDTTAKAASLLANLSADEDATAKEIKASAKQIEEIYTNVKALAGQVGTTQAITAVAENLAASALSDIVGQVYDNVGALIKGYSKDKAVTTVADAAGQKSSDIKTVYDNVAALKSGLSMDQACAMVASAAGKTTNFIKEAYIGFKQFLNGSENPIGAAADLVSGRAQLGEYEDGMATLRDGLDTLMATEANGGLESIASRVGEDEDFNTEDGFLDFDAAMNGVDQGRAYSADSGVAITKELTTRGIGTAAGLGAGLLGLIAAILAFAKKNKGAGVFALLSAAAAGVGIGMIKSAGTEFTLLAGSTVGSIATIAFAVIAAVGVIAAIAFFAAKKAA